MANISDTTTKIYNSMYHDMLNRYKAYKKNHSDNFKVFTKKELQGDYLYRSQFEDMIKRFDAWTKLHGYEPAYVTVKRSTTNGTSTSTNNGWILTGTYKADYQDTGYTCGPSSVQMVFSALGKTVYEAYIAKIAGTNTSGTTHGGLAAAVRKIDPSIKITEYNYKNIVFNGLAQKLKGNCEFIIHIRTGKLGKDAYGNKVWSNDYGHYIFLVGVNPTKGLFKVFDPTKGLKDFTASQIKAATSAVINQKSFICHCK